MMLEINVEIEIDPTDKFVDFYHTARVLAVVGGNSIELMKPMMKGEI